ncbi:MULTISPECIES: 16S rRNA (cytosine(967)-C(5))-methyltransferase RsmB [unclassified Comamonas]|uniref:16S rRNA (cytosine(967)-C(5))-methyltransferase RsmB n=1 Tax=unclassified Comamonas TaxID=2638500 RepID=UPI000A6083AF|nr:MULTISPECIES: 16S rRNA (cytosine(967)-C(5))-methyltransferase RsmB [unclassified Comamonas]MBN9331751.1 16S rRNA (cytosine(967)-C(5))-methyltransferase RsmB [Comamonas sp.]
MTDQTLSPPLWRLLHETAGCVRAVSQGTSATLALAAVAPPLRPGTQALVFHVLRQLGRARALARALVSRQPQADAHALLVTALALLWDPLAAPYESFTLVNQAVEAARRNASTRAQAGFINACLRRFLRERDALVAATQDDEVARTNHPAWWLRRLRADHPERWQDIVEVDNRPPSMTLRVSESKTTVEKYQQALTAIGMKAVETGDNGLILCHPVPVSRLPGFDAGWVAVQDAAAQRAAPLLLDGLDPQRPLRVLDACAAPGGKTAHLADWAKARGAPWSVTALEVDAQRARRIDENLRRLDLAAQVLVADAGAVDAWWPAAGDEAFDAVLLDAPCTASGIVRRHPDVRWLRRESDIAQLAAQQARLLEALWPCVRAGGRLLYSTCSVFRAEGDEQIAAFLARHTDARLMPSPGHMLPTQEDASAAVRDNADREHDGFFYALLRKSVA